MNLLHFSAHQFLDAFPRNFLVPFSAGGGTSLQGSFIAYFFHS
jgi:hypothetical protein